MLHFQVATACCVVATWINPFENGRNQGQKRTVQCIIASYMHTKTINEKDGLLVSPQTYKSWQILFETAKIRNHNLIFRCCQTAWQQGTS